MSTGFIKTLGLRVKIPAEGMRLDAKTNKMVSAPLVCGISKDAHNSLGFIVVTERSQHKTGTETRIFEYVWHSNAQRYYNAGIGAVLRRIDDENGGVFGKIGHDGKCHWCSGL